MPLDLLNVRVFADFASDALHFKLLDPDNVIAWADSMIAESSIPPDWLMDLSLADRSDTLSVCSALRNVPGRPDPEKSLRLVNALVLREWRLGRLPIGQVRGIGWQLYRSEFEQSDLSKWGVIVECQGESLDAGDIPESTMREVIDRELGIFDEYIQALPPWADSLVS